MISITRPRHCLYYFSLLALLQKQFELPNFELQIWKEEPASTMAPEAKESWIHRARSRPHVQGGNISVLGSHLVAASGEFVGTFFFLWLGYGGQLMALTQAAAPAGTGGGASSETVVFISLIYSFSLLVNAWAFYRISGGLFNPAVSFPI